MQIKNLAIHEMKKTRGEFAAMLDTSADNWSINDPVIVEFAEKLRDRFAAAGNAYANVGKETIEQRDGQDIVIRNNTVMQEVLLESLECDGSSVKGFKDFSCFSEKCGREVEKFIKENGFATGGHIVYIAYDYKNVSYLLVVLMKMTEGYGMNYTQSKMLKSQIFNMDYFQEGVRINLNTWSGFNPDVDRCMNFVKRRGDDDVSKYFRDAMGCVDYAESKRNTGLVIDAVLDYLDYKVEKNDYDAQEKERRSTVVQEYLWGKLEREELVQFKEVCRLASPVNNDSEHPEMEIYCKNHKKIKFHNIDAEFEVSKDKMRDKLRVAGQVGTSKFSVSANDIKTKAVEIFPSECSVTFNNVDQKIIERLVRFMT